MPSKRRGAVFTGAGAGIGRAIAEALAEQGHAVIAADRDEPAATPPGSAFVRADVTDADAVAALFATARERFGRLDALVNNAGVAGAPGWEEHDHPRPEDWRAAFRVHVLGTVGCIEAALPALGPASALSTSPRSRGAKVAPCSGTTPRRRRPSSSSHAPLRHAAPGSARRSTPSALASSGRRCGSASASPSRTPSRSTRGSRSRRSTRPWPPGRVPLRRGQTPRSIAAAAAFLASSAAEGLNGEILTVDGGIYPS